MKLYRKKASRNFDALSQQLKNASGIKNVAHLPHGFETVASFDFGDIFVDDAIFQKLNIGVQAEIDSCLCRFLREDYGLITDEEREQNGELKYFGSGYGLIAKYQTSIGIITILLDRNTTIFLFS